MAAAWKLRKDITICRLQMAAGVVPDATFDE
jgi:hypothetical protein